MTDTIDASGFVLRRTYRASPERLFRAFTDPGEMCRWYAPVAGWEVSHAEVDPRLGGGYHLEFGPPGSDQIIEKGTFREFDPPNRLVFEVALSGGIDEATRVTVEFVDHGEETEVVVSETGYSSGEITRRHAGGWSTMLDQLRGVVGE
jgi:uncharacterized protein YndB with AHSA1/START domain